MSNEEEPFLQRWSRRKIDARKRADPPQSEGQDSRETPAPPPAQPSRPETTNRTGEEAKRVLTEADFADVDFDALDFNSDYSRFLAAGVPETIRNRALRKLWASDTIFTQIDPLQDYAGDFTDAAVAVPAGTLKTAYKIGRGFMTDAEAAEWEKLGKPPAAKTAAAGTTEQGAPVAQPRPAATLAASIKLEDPEQPEVVAFISESDALLPSRSPAASSHPLGSVPLSHPNVRFLVARCEGAAVGCGALVIGVDGSAEIKRMFVAPQARGRSIGRQILRALEQQARDAGVHRVWLQTGNGQLEALQLWRSHGYNDCGSPGGYSDDRLSVFMDKRLD